MRFESLAVVRLTVDDFPILSERSSPIVGMHECVTQPQRLPTALGIQLSRSPQQSDRVLSLAHGLCKRKTQSACRIDAPWL